jgi:hypothetical protein
MRPKIRIITAAAVIALLTGGSVAAAEAATSPSATPSGSSSAAASPAPSDGAANARAKAKAATEAESLAGIAQRLHVSVSALEHALADAKQYLGSHGLNKPDPAVCALVAKDLGISTEQARALVDHVFSGRSEQKRPVTPGTPDPQITAALAKVMGIGQDKAAQVLERLDAIASASDHGVSPTDPAFRALAASLGLSADQLGHDIQRMKQSLAASMPAPSSSPNSQAPADAPSPKG